MSATGLSCVWMTSRWFVANLGTKESRLPLNNGQALPQVGTVETASRGVLKKEKALEGTQKTPHSYCMKVGKLGCRNVF